MLSPSWHRARGKGVPGSQMCTAVGEDPTGIPSTQLPLEPHRGPAGLGELQSQAEMGMCDSEGCARALVAAPVQPQPLGPWRGKLSKHSSIPSQFPSLLQTPSPCSIPLTLPMAPDQSCPIPLQSLHLPQNNSQLLAAPQNI